MFQDFAVQSRPETGPPRLAQLRAEMRKTGLDGFIIPRADAHQGEYVAECDARLAWLTGFTGSAGSCIALADRAGIFVDGRYRLQVRHEVDPGAFTPVNWHEMRPGPWLAKALPEGGRVGFDPWLHTTREIADIEQALESTGIELVPVGNPIDAIWTDRPAPPAQPARIHPPELAGETSEDKRARLGAMLVKTGARACVLTLPDSICWLLNIRGADIARTPLVQAFAILHADGCLTLFADPAKFNATLRAHLGPRVTLRPVEALVPGLRALSGPVQVDPKTAPVQVARTLQEAGHEIIWAVDPCLWPKACKNAAEIAGMVAAHDRDAAAMVEFLCWLDNAAPNGNETEISVVKALERFRRATKRLIDISFDTISSVGPNGAMIHYRVSEASNLPIRPGEILLVDSGGQYPDGTTDITRTMPVGPVMEAARRPYTRVLQGMIALSRARWPRGLAGRDLDALARGPLWAEGWDYDHGTGHGVGAALCVHEGPVRISPISELPLEPGMILSNEPGYYRVGAFGIRIENLLLVEKAPGMGDNRDQLGFRTLTHVPIDKRLIVAGLLSPDERDWLNAYHAGVLARIGPHVSKKAKTWLKDVCAPL